VHDSDIAVIEGLDPHLAALLTAERAEAVESLRDDVNAVTRDRERRTGETAAQGDESAMAAVTHKQAYMKGYGPKAVAATNAKRALLNERAKTETEAAATRRQLLDIKNGHSQCNRAELKAKAGEGDATAINRVQDIAVNRAAGWLRNRETESAKRKVKREEEKALIAAGDAGAVAKRAALNKRKNNEQKRAHSAARPAEENKLSRPATRRPCAPRRPQLSRLVTEPVSGSTTRIRLNSDGLGALGGEQRREGRVEPLDVAAGICQSNAAGVLV
jgi:hypothetical protein